MRIASRATYFVIHRNPKETGRMSAKNRSSRFQISQANARYLDSAGEPLLNPPPEEKPPFLNISAVEVEFGVNYWTFMMRQRRGWPATGKPLQRARLAWRREVGAAGGYESYFERTQIERALRPQERSD